MCDGWASSNVQLTAPLKPAQSSTLRFPGAPDGRGTPLAEGAGSPDTAGSPDAAGAGLATAPLATHPDAASRPKTILTTRLTTRPATRPGPRRRIHPRDWRELSGI